MSRSATAAPRHRPGPDASDDAPIVYDGAGKCFGGTWVLQDLDLVLPAGVIVGLIGPSGSGKTTTMRMANGVLRPDAGRVRVLGTEPTRLAPHERSRIGYLPQSPVLFEELTLWENMNFHASLNGVRLRRRKRLHALLDLVDLDGQERKLVREASGGMKRRLALAATLGHDPSVLMLDEPTAGIDPILRRRFWEHFRSVRDQGRTLLISTQYVGEAADCDLVALLAEGRLKAFGAPEELRRDAYGGTVIEIEVDGRIEEPVIAAVAERTEVVSCRLVDPARLSVVVDDAHAMVPLLERQLADVGLHPIRSGEVPPSYDDVFIRLVEEAGPDDEEPEASGPSVDDGGGTRV